MSNRALLRWPDKRLRTAAVPVEAITDKIRALWEEMIAVMVAMPGVGLAAPQLGVMLRVAVVDGDGNGKAVIRMANPEVLQSSPDQSDYAEASPNLSGVSARITRPAKVEVAYLDHHGLRVRNLFEGIWATSVQHQIDHLDGRMYFDHLGPVKRRMLLDRAKKLARRR